LGYKHRMRLALALLFLLLAACEPTRPTPPDAGPDTPPIDAPAPIDVGACPAFGGAYVGTTTCPGISIGSFAACVAQQGCEGTLHLAVAGDAASFAVEGARGTFSDPSLPAGITCDRVDVAGAELELECTDRGGIGCTMTLVRRSFERTGLCCTSSAECAGGAGCTLVPIGGGAVETTACVDRVSAPRGLGEGCARTAPGDDDCAAGLFCTPLGSETGLVCRSLCRSELDCAAGEVCTSSGTAPQMGTCLAACDPFDGAACGAGLGCQPTAILGAAVLGTVCTAAGAAALGEPCEASGCLPGLFCARTELLELRCATPCDAGHPCASGTCIPLEDGVALGTCRG
jgi:hypothetical protein